MYRKITKWYGQLLSWLLAFSVATLIFPVSLQIFSRYTDLIPSYIWTEEMARFFLVWTVMIGAMLGVRESRADELVAAGHPLRIYVPFGQRWYEYSLRRLQENPAMAGTIARATAGRVLGLGDRSAVAEHNDVLPDRGRAIPDGLDLRDAGVERLGGARADRSLGGQSHVGDQHVGAGARHVRGLAGVEHIRCGE